MRKFCLAAVAAVACLSATGAAATTIDFTAGSTTTYAIGGGPFGQSFTAVDPVLNSLGFYYTVINDFAAPTPITITLLNGAGLGGSVVAARTFSLANTDGVTDTDFGATALMVGNLYTAVLSTASYYEGVRGFRKTNPYADGQAYAKNGPGDLNCTVAGCDLAFRVVGSSGVVDHPQAVPEPAAWMLMLSGFFAIGAGRRHARRAGPLVSRA
jgi:hypothetical protein